MISKHFTGFLTFLIVLNVAILLFAAVGVGWQQIVDVPVHILRGMGEPFHNRLEGARTDDSQNVQPVSDVVSDTHIKLVCSDETFAAAVSRVRPAVVNISCERIEPMTRAPGGMRFDDPYQDLAMLGGIGSGMVVHRSGYILTCHHVVSNATNIYVTPFGPNVKRHRARVIAKDEDLNLALLKINTTVLLPEVTTGMSAKMEVADVVLAIGSPFGLEQSVTHGIISDNERDLLIGGKLFSGMLQTDVPINRGSSGGPLININGEVIAINMAIYSISGVYNGVSFAMPIDKAKPFLAKTIPLLHEASSEAVN
ncbi:MAG: trypsin-like peptidase domain-containing protein [Deltaproteobacteria bacterium]|nr:trypsin-like peptidase domain-containing protein [Deltaproteobacteria bacterium]